MSGFIGTYRNLIGETLTGFKVTGIAGRDSSGAPAFRVECDKCLYNQTLPYSKLAPLVGSATQRSLRCTNSACPASRQERQVETLADIRRAERQQKEAAAEESAAAERAAELSASKRQVQAARFAVLQAQYRTYWLHQIKTTIKESAIPSFSRWCELAEGSRQKLLDICAADSTAQIHGF